MNHTHSGGKSLFAPRTTPQGCGPSSDAKTFMTIVHAGRRGTIMSRIRVLAIAMPKMSR